MASPNAPIAGKPAKKGQKQNLVIQNITIKQPTRQSVDIKAWRQALQGAESTTGRRIRLYDLYEDLMLDNVLGDAIDKRIMAITNSNIVFQRSGEPVPEMEDLIDSDDFERLIAEILNAKFWGISVVEFDFTNGFACANIPRKHINPRTGEILMNQTDDKGIPYRDDPFFLEIGDKNNLGLILKAAPYVIYKRGSFGDWAQFAELFGMPFRKGTYNSYDDYTRKQLEEALEKAGGAPWIVIPKDGNIEYIENKSAGNGGAVFDLLRKACNEEILIGLMGQTMTTLSGSSKSQSETHKDVENAINKADRKFVNRVLNRRLLPILEARGFPVKDGRFTFPEESEDVSLKDRIDIDTKLDSVIEIPPEYFYEKYGIPKPKGTLVKKTKKEPDPINNPPGKLSAEMGVIQKLFSFFLKTPTAGHTELCPMCGGTADPLITLSSLTTEELWKIITKLAGQLHTGALPADQTSADLSLATGDFLMDALKNVFPKFNDLQDDSFSTTWLNRQQSNIYAFATAKSYDQLKEMRDAIVDPQSGDIKPFSQFLIETRQIHTKFNEQYLETEHIAVVRGTVMGAKWIDLENHKDVAPFLEYVTAGDDRVRESHRKLRGIIEPLNSDFWNQYYPPNGWRCRCSVKQLSEREAEHSGFTPGETGSHMKTAGKLVPDKYWRKNVGKTAILEADGTAYIKAVPGKGKKQLHAVDHYGMKPFSEIQGNDSLPAASRMTRQEYDNWVKENGHLLKNLKDSAGIPVTIDNDFLKHLADRGEHHYGVAAELLSVIKHPDEVWVQRKSLKRDDESLLKISMKYYSGKTIAMITDQNGLARSFYEVEHGNVEDFRKGILVQKKKPG